MDVMIGHLAGMSVEASAQLILLGAVLCVLVIILLVLGSICRSLARLEHIQSRQDVADSIPVTPTVSDASLRKSARKADFADFLSEDPQRKRLPKSEQFAAYRTWRREKGLNWPRVGGNQTPI